MGCESICQEPCARRLLLQSLNEKADVGFITEKTTGLEYSQSVPAGPNGGAAIRVRTADGERSLLQCEVSRINWEAQRRQQAADKLGTLLATCEGSVGATLPDGRTVQVCGIDAKQSEGVIPVIPSE